MCLAIVKPAGKTIDKTAMQHASIGNPDGCGFAVRINKQVLIEKGLWTFEEFWSRFAPYMRYEALVHFRWASMGTVNTENCHPFALTGGGALIHNGHMDAYGSKSQSDTAHWVETVLAPLLRTYPNALRHPSMRRVLEDSIGHSKMCLLTATRTIILNEELGHWAQGVWYSNASYEAPARPRQSLVSAEDTRTTPRWEDDPQDTEGWCDNCYTGHGTHLVCQACFRTLEEDSTWSS